MLSEPMAQVVKSKPEEHTVLEFKLKTDLRVEPIIEQLKKHQIIADWDKQNLMHDLHVWTERYIFEFKLKIDKAPALMIDSIGRSKYGHFRRGRNGFGLLNEIAINETYLEEQEYWQVLGTLLHELLHAEQEQTGNPGKHNYHNKTFKKRAESLGLIIDQWGHTQYSPAPSPFWDILDKHGVKAADMPTPDMSTLEAITIKPGKSKL